MKGTFSELELSTLRQRSQEALRLKAARGEPHTTVAIGYRRGADDRLEQDPDRRIREALSLVSTNFVRSAACASSSCGWARSGSTCRPLSMVLRGARCGGGRRATTPSIGC
ncbi:hypothetical protein [Mesorhizobium sp.]|uniref:hypothetical protein n=1 Tax=Mesorhizobium sp. TaxID=1871066 RepID=UPI0025BA4188|nr:hypothetical protein [Mesorhizobium sp.]